MSTRRWLLPVIALLVAGAIYLAGPEILEGPVVVVYTSVDQVHANKLLMQFTDQTGIAFRASYDVEAHKTTGLYNKILEERDAPIADVFWNSEASRTEMLKREGLLEPYVPQDAASIPAMFKDPDGAWHGFAVRARVIVYSEAQFAAGGRPRRLEDLLDPALRGKVGIANPLFGTTGSHVAALFAAWGEEKATGYLDSLKENEIRVLSGNSTVRDRVARGDLWAGLTDTDDVWVGKENGWKIGMTFPDADGLGTLVIPNTVAMIRNCRHPDEAKALIDFLVGRRSEEFLAKSPSRNMPVRSNVPVPAGAMPLSGVRAMEVTIPEIVDAFPASEAYVRETFLAE